QVKCVSVLADGRVVTGGTDGYLRLVDPVVGTVEILTRHAYKISSVCALEDDRAIYAGEDGTVSVFDVRSKTQHILNVHYDHYEGFAKVVALGRGRVALLPGNCEPTITDLQTGETFTLPGFQVTDLAEMPDGQLVYTTLKGVVVLSDPLGRNERVL